MTTQQKFESMLIERGMFESQATKVMEIAKPMFVEAMPNYKFTWDRPAEEYPDAVYTVGFLIVKRAAIQWIDEYLPRAWFRPIFL